MVDMTVLPFYLYKRKIFLGDMEHRLLNLPLMDSDCSHEIKRCLLLGRKGITNLGGILKSRDITLLTKVCIVKAMVFQYSCTDVRVEA